MSVAFMSRVRFAARDDGFEMHVTAGDRPSPIRERGEAVQQGVAAPLRAYIHQFRATLKAKKTASP